MSLTVVQASIWLFQKSASSSAQSHAGAGSSSAPATSAAIETARVKALIPSFSSQRSWAVEGPVRAMKPSALRTMSATAMPRKPVALAEGGGEQHRERGLVELDAAPERRAAEPLVLVPMTVLVLCRDQIAQRIGGLALGAERQERAGAFNQIARPYQMIAAALVAVSPHGTLRLATIAPG